jgi:hypothetical protein
VREPGAEARSWRGMGFRGVKARCYFGFVASLRLGAWEIWREGLAGWALWFALMRVGLSGWGGRASSRARVGRRHPFCPSSMSGIMKWLSDHVFLASWLSVLIALLTMLWQSHKTNLTLRWSTITLRLGFLICLSAVLTPSVDTETRHVVEVLTGCLLGVLVVRSGQE